MKAITYRVYGSLPPAEATKADCDMRSYTWEAAAPNTDALFSDTSGNLILSED